MKSRKAANIAAVSAVALASRGPVAQWSEHPAYIRAVPGSSPGGPTNPCLVNGGVIVLRHHSNE